MRNGSKNNGRAPATRRAGPDEYRPRKPSELIGPARKIASSFLKRLNKDGSRPKTLKVIFYGDIGAGKNRVALMIARALTVTNADIERQHGRNVTIELVRRWQFDSNYTSLFGGWKIKMINEVDLMPSLAQDLMLDYLDELSPETAVLATSNLDVATLTTRFQTRFELVKVKGPTDRALASWLQARWNLPKSASAFISLGASGNVRAALLDAVSYLSHGTLEKRPKAPTQDDWRKLRAAQLREKRRANPRTRKSA